ncbi:hypothetical protein DPX39_100139900 [Trypanosoma brucei equiperdum]|uniref:Uncharacterized protein n=1 Tax=Trypanosoma brucei equiperdum TaxID=630700 RepID=A0A3L6KY62_9TRYP|nr:hypothetical protein DPX39_100139900 [Trypanosoma brucei equiperdum]
MKGVLCESGGGECCSFTRSFLSTVQHQLAVQCCRVLAQLTASTSKSFLEVARRGRSPQRHGVATRDAAEDPSGRRDELGMHLAVYRSVRSAVAASCALGHRSCHMLWGPRGCGAHRLLRLLAQDCMEGNNTFVLYLDGDVLNSDEDALRSIGQQMLTFLRSSNSKSLRSADTSFSKGTFDFGSLFGFGKLMALDKISEGAVQTDAECPSRTKQGSCVTKDLKVSGHEKDGKAGRKRPRLAVPDELLDDGSASEDDDSFHVTSTTAYAMGGASSALAALQRALLLMRTHGTNLIVCIRRVERFGVWCDQLLYVLSGLMHESDGQGGGMSLVMTSSTPDIRQLEKRLSSRLTCEARCIPLLPWSVSCVARACLVEVKERLELKVNTVKARNTKRGRLKKVRSVTDSGASGCTTSHSFTGWRFDAVSAGVAQDQSPEGEVNGYLTPPEVMLLETAMLEMSGYVLTELSAVARSPQQSVSDVHFAQRIMVLSGQLRSVGATAGRVMTAVSAVFGEVCSGEIPLLSSASCGKLLSWFERTSAKLKVAQNIRSAVFSVAPEAVKSLWRGEFTNANRKSAGSVKPLRNYALLVDDMLSECKLVELGYCTREMFLLLTYVYLRHEAGVVRTVVDLLEDVASSMGTHAAAALDRAAFTAAVGLLNRWRIVRVGGRDGSTAVSLRGSPARLREFLQEVLHRSEYCSETLGLDTKEVARLRSLV